MVDIKLHLLWMKLCLQVFEIIILLSRAWWQLSWCCSFFSYIIWLNGASWRVSVTETELVIKGFPLVWKGTRAALNGNRQKELTQFNSELGLFVSEPRSIGSGGDKLKVGSENFDDKTQSIMMDERASARRGTYHINIFCVIISSNFSLFYIF